MGTIRKPPSYQQRCEEWAAIAELAIKHDLVVHFHEYRGWGAMMMGIRPSEAFDVLGMTCSRYPELKVLINHGGGQAENEVREAIQFASSFNNVYLETGYWKAEFYEMAIHDQNVTCKRLIWGGGDTGSRIWMHHALQAGGQVPERAPGLLQPDHLARGQLAAGTALCARLVRVGNSPDSSSQGPQPRHAGPDQPDRGW